MTTNTIRPPGISSSSDIVCASGNQNFSLVNAPAGSTISWDVSPASMVQQASGTGTLAALRAANSSVSGNATLTFRGTCNAPLATRTLWVGKPGWPVIDPLGDFNMSQGSFLNMMVFQDNGADFSSPPTLPLPNIWWTSGAITNIGSIGQSTTLVASQVGTGTYYARTYNTCGFSPTRSGTVTVSSGGGGFFSRIAPNPTFGELTVTFPPEQFMGHYNLTISDLNGRVCLRRSSDRAELRLSIGELPPGIYLLEATDGRNHFSDKVVLMAR